MTRIGLLSDTHSYLDKRVFEYFADVDEIWHAGDIGSYEVLRKLREYKPTRAVYGNMDGGEVRYSLSEFYRFRVEEVNVLMTHIGGYPGHYNPWLLPMFQKETPQLFVCGHSHILKVQFDPTWKMLTMNPGAAGLEGWQTVQTVLRFAIDGAEIKDLEVVEMARKR
ncbi:MAG: metallophosphoesterase family protein [Paludibacteraceae bacterium]|nr:metallophosphoesterase family protein [Paludibacteraceae bacterium]